MAERDQNCSDTPSDDDAVSLPLTIDGDVHADSLTQYVAATDVRTELPTEFAEYRILREIGRGGMGVVFEALEVSLNRRVALKVLTAASQLDALQQKRFRHESRAVALLNHANVVPIYSAGEYNGISYFAMRLIPGRNLSQVIQEIRAQLSETTDARARSTRRPAQADTAPVAGQETPRGSSHQNSNSGSPISLSSDDFCRDPARRKSTTSRKVADTVARIGVEAALALQHAHDLGVIHRDVKPSNLILDDDGKIWVTDFGLAHLPHEPSITRTGELLGTLRYMSPEQAAGRPAFVDTRTDIYSLGVTLVELLTLKRLVPGTTTQQILQEVVLGQRPAIRRIDPSVPSDLATVLEKAISRNPGDRYQTARDFADDLTRFLNGQPIHAHRPGLWKQTRYWMSRHEKLVAAAAVGLICTCVVSLAAAGFVWTAFQGEQQAHQRTTEALTESEGLRLLAQASLQAERNPGLGLALAALGAASAPGPEANNTLLSALESNHEYASVQMAQRLNGGIAISRDGQFAVLTASAESSDKTVRPGQLVRMADGSVLHTLAPGHRVTSAAFSPDGRYVVTASAAAEPNSSGEQPAGRVPPVVWEAASGRRVAEFPDATLPRATAGTFDAASQKLVLLQGNEAVAWDIRSRKVEAVYRGHSQPITHAEFSPDGTYLLTVADDETVRVWNAESATAVGEEIAWADPAGFGVTAGFTADSQHLFVSDLTGTRLFDIAADAVTPAAVRTSNRIAVSRSADIALLYNAHLPQFTVVSSVDFATISEFQIPQFLEQSHVALSPDGRFIAVASENEAMVFAAETGRLVSNLRGHEATIRALAVDNDERVATLDNSGILKLWTVRSDGEQRTFAVIDAEGSNTFVQLNAVPDTDGRLIAVPSRPRAVTTVRSADGSAVPGEFRGTASITCDAASLATSSGKVVRVFDTTVSREVYRGEFLQNIKTVEHTDSNRERLLLITFENRALLVSTRTNSRLDLLDPGETVTARHVPPGGGTMFLATSAARLVALSGTTGELLWMRRSTHPLISIDVSAAGDRVVAADSVGNISFWDVEDEEQQQPGRVLDDLDAAEVMFCDGDDKVVVRHRGQRGLVSCIAAQDGSLSGEQECDGRVRMSCHGDKPLVAIASDESGLIIWNVEDDVVNRLQDDATLTARFLGDVVGAVSRHEQGGTDAGLRFSTWRVGASEPLSNEVFRSTRLALHADLRSGRFVLTEVTHGADVFDAATGRYEFASLGHPAKVEFMGFTREPKRLVTVSADGTICLSEAARRENLRKQAPGAVTTAVDLSPDGQLLVTGNDEGQLVLWSTSELAEVRGLPSGAASVHSIRFDATGNLVVTTAESEPVRVLDLRTNRSTEIDIPDAVHAEISADGKNLLVLSGAVQSISLRAWLVDIASGRLTEVTQDGGTRWAKFSTAGDQFGLLSADGWLAVFNVDDRQQTSSFQPATRPVIRFAFSPDDRLLAVDQGKRLSCWSVPDGSEMFHVTQLGAEHYRQERDLHWQPFTSDGTSLLVTDFGVRKTPVDPQAYVEQLPPRELTPIEKRRLRLDLMEPRESRD